MRLHLGCGKKYRQGWVNIDGGGRCDVVHDLSTPLPYGDGEALEIEAIHLFEHFYPQDVEGILTDWHRVLMKGGKLTLEMPDIYKSAKNLIAEIDRGEQPSNKWAMWPIYGDNPDRGHYDCHKWGWTFKTLSPILLSVGFRSVVECSPQHHGRKVNRDFRIEAIK